MNNAQKIANLLTSAEDSNFSVGFALLKQQTFDVFQEVDVLYHNFWYALADNFIEKPNRSDYKIFSEYRLAIKDYHQKVNNRKVMIEKLIGRLELIEEWALDVHIIPKK